MLLSYNVLGVGFGCCLKLSLFVGRVLLGHDDLFVVWHLFDRLKDDVSSS